MEMSLTSLKYKYDMSFLSIESTLHVLLLLYKEANLNELRNRASSDAKKL